MLELRCFCLDFFQAEFGYVTDFFYVFLKNQGKNDRLPTFFYVFSKIQLFFYYINFCKHRKMLGLYLDFSKNVEKVWDIETICNIAKFWKKSSKKQRSPKIFLVKVFGWTCLWLLSKNFQFNIIIQKVWSSIFFFPFSLLERFWILSRTENFVKKIKGRKKWTCCVLQTIL